MKISIKHQKIRPLVLPAFVLAALVASVLLVFYLRSPIDALQNFNPGNIITDSKMADINAMNESQIRSFINQRNASCPSNNNLCLRNFRQNGKDAARIIFEVSREQRINPQVLLATLQKEQGLVTHTNPQQWMYDSAMGYGCPDSTPGVCSRDYANFTAQIVWGATHFRAHLDGLGSWSNRFRSGSGWYSSFRLGSNSIQYHPNASCGSATVNIQNRATQALYSYTPYTPNQAALNAGYGTGNNCSAYGNRNFYLYMRDWFNYTVDSVEFSGITFAEHPFSHRDITATFTVRNTGSSTVNLGRLKVEARGPNNEQFDFPNALNVSIRPGQTYTYRATRNIDLEGQFRFFVTRNHNNTWYSPAAFQDLGNNASTEVNYPLTREPTLVESLQLSEGSIHQNQPINATFAIRNNSSVYSVSMGRFKVEGRHSDGTQYDFGSTVNNLTIAPSQTYRYESTRTLPKTGRYDLRIMNYREQFGWRNTFPSNASGVVRNLTITAGQPVTITGGLELSKTSLRTDENLVAKFSITNFSDRAVNVGRMKVEGRHSDGTQYDFGSTTDNLTLQPGQTFNYESTRSLPKAGSYTFTLMNFREKERWSTSFPVSENGSIQRNASVSVSPAVTVIRGLQFSPSSIHQNENITATFAVKNHSNRAVSIGRTKVECQNGTAGQFNFASTVNNLTLAPGETYEYESRGALPAAGSWSCKLVNFREKERWSESFPASDSASIIRNQTLSVKQPVTVIHSLDMSKTTANRNENITATFAVKNHSNRAVSIGRTKVECRHNTAGQLDFASTVNNLTLAPGETYIYSSTRALPVAGSWNCKLMNFRDKERWSDNFPANESSNITRSIRITIN